MLEGEGPLSRSLALFGTDDSEPSAVVIWRGGTNRKPPVDETTDQNPGDDEHKADRLVLLWKDHDAAPTRAEFLFWDVQNNEVDCVDHFNDVVTVRTAFLYAYLSPRWASEVHYNGKVITRNFTDRASDVNDTGSSVSSTQSSIDVLSDRPTKRPRAP